LKSVENNNSKNLFSFYLILGVQPGDIIFIPEFQQQLIYDFESLSEIPGDADTFFSFPIIPCSILQYKNFLASYETILHLLKTNKKNKYEKVHKGTPYYLLSIGSFISDNFEKAIYYMDAALKEDERAGNDLEKTPAGLFFELDDTKEEQAAKEIVSTIKNTLESKLQEIKSNGGPVLTIEDIKNRISKPALSSKPELRTIVTSLLSFFYEYQSKKRLFDLTLHTEGTAEPFYLFLMKGCIIFESLIKRSDLGKRYAKTNLGEFLKEKEIYEALGFNSTPLNENVYTFINLRDLLNKQKSCKSNFVESSVITSWSIRNLLFHSIAWPEKPTEMEFEQMHNLIIVAIVVAISCLYQ